MIIIGINNQSFNTKFKSIVQMNAQFVVVFDSLDILGYFILLRFEDYIGNILFLYHDISDTCD